MFLQTTKLGRIMGTKRRSTILTNNYEQPKQQVSREELIVNVSSIARPSPLANIWSRHRRVNMNVYLTYEGNTTPLPPVA